MISKEKCFSLTHHTALAKVSFGDRGGEERERPLYAALFSVAVVAACSDYQVIYEVQPHKFTGTFHVLRETVIVSGWRAAATGVIVYKCYYCGIFKDCSPYDNPDIDRRFCDTAD